MTANSLRVVEIGGTNEATARKLRELADKAEAGEVTSVAVAVVCRGRHTGSVFEVDPADTIADLYLAIERLKLRLLDHGAG